MAVITRIKGGLGNQLFCYAAARRLAYANNTDLVIDDRTGFERDATYRRIYRLDGFAIAGRKARAAERLEPFERGRRAIAKWTNRLLPFSLRKYIEQQGVDFDERLLSAKVRGRVYLDGLWQSELYFKDIEAIIRKDIQLIDAQVIRNRASALGLAQAGSVSIHVRWFDMGENDSSYNLNERYYENAISLMFAQNPNSRLYVFSDQPARTRELGWVKKYRPELVVSQGSELTDFGLMSSCQHHIIANSTFSWWAAWLSCDIRKLVIAPQSRQHGISAWGFKGLIPNAWTSID